MNEEGFNKRLFELCLKHDIRYGVYPESEFEGDAIYEEYVLERFSDWDERIEKYRKELEAKFKNR